MDARRHGNPQLHHAVNGGRSSKPGEDEALLFLSHEEQECLKFFEKTIDSLDESLEPGGGGAPTSNPGVSSHLARHPAHKDQDIIYLVRPEPDLVQTKEPIFNPASPDFNSMMQNPGSHFEMKPRREAIDSLPSEYHPPLPKSSFGSTDNHSSYHPPGCIPTPVLIAQQIADHRGGGTANLPSSSFLRSHSQESDKPQSPAGDSPGKHGPLNSTKPPQFPANISVILGGKDHQNQSLGNVNIQERRAQMLANLTGATNPLLQEDPQPNVALPTVEVPPVVQPPVEPPTVVLSQNTPTRSISFKDPSPDKSRMEALSKLGLSRNRAMSEGLPLLGVPSGPSLNPQTGAETSAKPIETSAPPTLDTTVKTPEANVTTPRPSPIESKPEILRTDSLKRYDERHPRPSPSYYPPPPPLDDVASFPPPPEVTLSSNNYGGKSITVNPSVSTRRGSATPPGNEPKVLPTALSNPSEFNSYGGKTKVINTAPVAMARSDLPDILSSHMKSQTLPPDLNSYGVKSRTFNPASGSSRPSDAPAKSSKTPAPTPAPRPPRHSYHGGAAAPKPAPRAPSPEHRRRSTSMFRPQGITVQFSGRGATDESRREALRKLGLLKES
ncbi:proline and serine-rich protein 2 [Clinocottus analis]|uniref:proline and serine-rich protein 2 n=1 Tax=Clinocottus analis TaxID=304258 RepID=UPI0035C179B2